MALAVTLASQAAVYQVTQVLVLVGILVTQDSPVSQVQVVTQAILGFLALECQAIQALVVQ